MATEIKPKPKNNFTVMTFFTLYCLYKYAKANGRARVTAALMFCNVLTYFRKPGLIINAILPSIDLSQHKEKKRFYLSPFCHSRQNHFVYDMLKLLWNGEELEPMMGGLDYATMFGFLVLISQCINFVSRNLAPLAGEKWIYEEEKVVGCTNVMFALDYIRKALAEGDRYILGYRVPRYLSPWVELIVARIVGAGDILGNLGGVLTGFLYLQLKYRKRGPDPIAEMIRNLFDLIRSEDNSQDVVAILKEERDWLNRRQKASESAIEFLSVLAIDTDEEEIDEDEGDED